MNGVARAFRRLRYLLRLRVRDAELTEELQFHAESKRRELEAAGVAPELAPAATRHAMGDVTRMREDARAVWVRPWLEATMQDVLYALRGLRRQRGFTAVAITTLGVAIGMNTSVFTAFNGVFWRPWPVADPAAVVEVMTIRNGRERYADFLVGEYRYLAEHLQSVSGLVAIDCAATYNTGCNVWLRDAELRPAYVSGNTFDVLGVPMERGRGFLPDDDRAGATPAAVLSYDVWQRELAGDPAAIGREIRLDGVTFTVVGVTRRGFAGTSLIATDLWLPLSSMQLLRKRHRETRYPGVIVAARLAPGISRDQARAEIEAMLRALRARLSSGDDATDVQATRVRLVDTSLDPNPVKRRMGYAMFGVLLFGSALVILLACANLANVHLARAAARGREIAVRVSLGASRRRVIRQLLTESLVLASAASAVGLVVAYVGPSYLLRLIATDSLSTHPSPDVRVLAYGAVLALVTCLAFGLVPALHATNVSMGDALKGRYGIAGVNLSLRRVFLAVQLAASVVALCGAGFLMRGVARANGQDFGFVITGVSTITITVPGSQDSATTATMGRALLDGAMRTTNPRAVGATTSTPFGEREQALALEPGQDSASGRSVQILRVSASYFDVLGIPLVAGRLFGGDDASRGVILVNEALAKLMWPGANPIGRSLIIGSPLSVVGVIKDADTEGVAQSEGSVRPKVYAPIAGDASLGVPSFVVRDASPESIRTVRELAARLSPEARMTVAPLARGLDRVLAEARSRALLAAVIGAVVLVLVSIGIFGVFAYVVQQRTREIGIRLALGAQPADVVRAIVESSGRPIVIGLIVGLAGAVGESFVMRGYLFGLSPFDPVAYVTVLAMLAVAAVVAVYLPARRATRITPTVALRLE